MPRTLDGFRSDERRNADRSHVTEQRVNVPHPVVPFTEDGARRLGHRYWMEVTRASRRLVHCRETDDRVELRALGVGPALLRLGGPELSVQADDLTCTYRIRGGVLSLGESGILALSQTAHESVELRVVVDGFLARLGGGVLYGLQRRAHLAVSRRYFHSLLVEARR